MAGEAQRIDKWLFFARLVKSRSLAQKLVLAGAVRVNREKIDNPARTVRLGDVLTVAVARDVRVLRILASGTRRGPAPEARLLYEDLGRPPDAAPPVPDEGDPARTP
ncbi:RNA-binding S4 domain-containing protein [Aureimonas leprariae]|uniref:RNA-binding S4 domain-containing protein n=1 Tax=Plantimonas leprariae TaxID=2615207 RepID=A0A7V7PNI7_9HYPH|nr:RNA-binding S4 domain-containing protein [Aureimonas leprariae]